MSVFFSFVEYLQRAHSYMVENDHSKRERAYCVFISTNQNLFDRNQWLELMGRAKIDFDTRNCRNYFRCWYSIAVSFTHTQQQHYKIQLKHRWTNSLAWFPNQFSVIQNWLIWVQLSSSSSSSSSCINK